MLTQLMAADQGTRNYNVKLILSCISLRRYSYLSVQLELSFLLLSQTMNQPLSQD